MALRSVLPRWKEKEMFQNPMQMMSQFNQFRSQFQGDPKQEVQKLLNSGKMTQEQFNNLQGMASQFQQLLKNFM